MMESNAGRTPELRAAGQCNTLKLQPHARSAEQDTWVPKQADVKAPRPPIMNDMAEQWRMRILLAKLCLYMNAAA
jgi:hypothetical protein